MSWVAVAVGAGTLITGVASADASRRASNTAADAQSNAANAGIGEQRRQFDAVQALLQPYTQAGNGALTGQQNILGMNGAGAQQQAINGIQNSPMFGAFAQQGENAILQNASATGGLRGGNTQAALAQFRPQLLSALIDQQYQRLGGLAGVGQNAAAGVGNAGMQTGVSIAGLMQQQGAAQAGGALAGGRAQMGMMNAGMQGLGAFYGLGGFGSRPPPAQSYGATGWGAGADPNTMAGLGHAY